MNISLNKMKNLETRDQVLKVLGYSDKIPLKYLDLKKIIDEHDKNQSNVINNNSKNKKKPINITSNIEITKSSIDIFNITENKSKNDYNNKLRETIICNIINKQIPEEYYKDEKWIKLRNEVTEYLKKLKSDYKNVKCIIKAGRKFNYDFEIIFDDDKKNVYKIEWKSNAESINDTPQFVSPMKPSQYLSNNYEEYYYTTYVVDLLKNYDFDIPNKEDYMKQIHSDKPKCVQKLQEAYYKGCKSSSKFSNKEEDINFYKKAKNIAKISIENFIKNTDLNYVKLTNYLLESQKNKYYMLYKNNKIYLENINIDNYKIISYIKTKNSYIATTETGFQIKILLRWKNGNGIAFPAFQIS